MKSLLVLTALGLGCCASADAQIAVTKNAATTILDDAYGYNTRFPETAEPWEYNNNMWTLAFGDSYANCVRYPGGTVANFWNASTDKMFSKKTSGDASGWIDTAKIGFSYMTSIVSGSTQQINTLADLKTVVAATNATVLFVLNVVTPGKDFYASAKGWNRAINDHPGIAYNAANPDDWYKMLDARYEKSKQMLIKANAQGIPIKCIEIGNEQYLGACDYDVEAFPEGAANATAGQCFGIAANYLANKLKTDPQLSFLPANVVISVPGAVGEAGGTATRILNWNTQLTGALNPALVPYITMHSYQDADTSITTFTAANVKTNAATWLAGINQALQEKNANTTILNANTPYQVLWNELNPEHAGSAVAGQWGAALMQVFAGLWATDHKGVVFMHANLNSAHVANNQTGDLNIVGYALLPLMRASKGCTKASHLNFPGVANLGTSGRTVVQGQYFENASGSTRKACIMNFDSVSYTLNLSSVFTGTANLKISGQRHATPSATGEPIHMSEQTVATTSVVIQPYSVNFIRP